MSKMQNNKESYNTERHDDILSYIFSIRENVIKAKVGAERKIAFNVFLCKVCNSCWEKISQYKSKQRKSQIQKMHDFPTYGLKRKTCPECNSENCD